MPTLAEQLKSNPKMAQIKIKSQIRRGKRKATYSVKRGDSWFDIAGRMFADLYGGDIKQAQRHAGDLARANPHIANLRPGQQIRLPHAQAGRAVSSGVKPYVPQSMVSGGVRRPGAAVKTPTADAQKDSQKRTLANQQPLSLSQDAGGGGYSGDDLYDPGAGGLAPKPVGERVHPGAAPPPSPRPAPGAMERARQAVQGRKKGRGRERGEEYTPSYEYQQAQNQEDINLQNQSAREFTQGLYNTVQDAYAANSQKIRDEQAAARADLYYRQAGRYGTRPKVDIRKVAAGVGSSVKRSWDEWLEKTNQSGDVLIKAYQPVIEDIRESDPTGRELRGARKRGRPLGTQGPNVEGPPATHNARWGYNERGERVLLGPDDAGHYKGDFQQPGYGVDALWDVTEWDDDKPFGSNITQYLFKQGIRPLMLTPYDIKTQGIDTSFLKGIGYEHDPVTGVWLRKPDMGAREVGKEYNYSNPYYDPNASFRIRGGGGRRGGGGGGGGGRRYTRSQNGGNGGSRRNPYDSAGMTSWRIS